MSLIDRRSDKLVELNLKIKTASSFSEACIYMNDAHQLAVELREEISAMSALKRGWNYMPPSGAPS